MKFPEKLRPYRGLIIFIIVLFSANYTWKFLIRGDETDKIVTLLGANISAPFNFMARNIASACYKTLHLLGSSVSLMGYKTLIFPNMHAVHVDWSCTAIKQTYIFVCIMLFSRGAWREKIWYIVLGISAIYLFNIFRISCIAALIENHASWFDFMHRIFFKTLFYALILLLWIVWEEKFVKTEETLKM
jgi:exosortase/archaeosortase family protein